MPDKVPDKVRDTVSSTARAWVRPRPLHERHHCLLRGASTFCAAGLAAVPAD